MKKIMFNDRYGLTQAVLSGRKTMTRRKLTLTLHKESNSGLVEVFPEKIFFEDNKWKFVYDNYPFLFPKESYPKYKVGDVVAIAQSYKDAGIDAKKLMSLPIKGSKIKGFVQCSAQYTPGWLNKMFVCADLMSHHIRITNVRVERFLDISDEDCIKEGIRDYSTPNEKRYGYSDFERETIVAFRTPREAFASLIDKISGNDTWKSNHWVFVYEFELVD